MTTPRIRITAGLFAVAGLLFVLYPAIRPFSDETGLGGAAAFGSAAWVLAHSLAVIAFVLLELGMFGAYLHLQESEGERPMLVAIVLTCFGIGLTLPFYGAEVFGLHAIGQAALKQNNPALVSLASDVRGEPGIWFVITGLVLLGAGTIAFAIAVWKSRPMSRWIGIPLAVGFSLYIPQFVAPQAIRVAHGLLITVACMLIAWNLVGSRWPVKSAVQGGMR